MRRTAIACLLSAVALAQGFTLSDRAKGAECGILLPDGSGEAQRWAASELAKYTGLLTGKPLQIAPELSGKRVVFVEKKEMKRDSFRLAVEGERLNIEASSGSGWLYGAYELLERFGGCRWYSSDVEKIPAIDVFSVPDDLDIYQEPAFALREPLWYDVMKHPDFAAKIRANGPSARLGAKHGGVAFRFGGGLGSCHTFNTLIPPDKYFGKHPEWFSEINGKRKKDHSQLCLTNPELLARVVTNVLERIRKDPTAGFYGVSQNDWYNFCTCKNCKAVDEREESHAGTMIAFVNKIAEEVEKEFPDAIIETLAYQYTRKPPKTIRPRHNVMPCLCTIECDFSHALGKSPYAQNKSFENDIKGWRGICKRLYVWDYTTDFRYYAGPHPNVLALQGNVKFFRDNNVEYLFEQGAYQADGHAEFAELKAWLLAKWMWNPELPKEELLQDFFSGFYGKAAPWIRMYFDALHGFWRDPAQTPMGCFTSIKTKVYPEGFFERATLLMEEAEKAAKDETELTRRNVRAAKFPVLYARLLRNDPAPLACLSGNPDKVRGKQSENSKIATEMLAIYKELGGIRLSESKARHDEQLRTIEQAARQREIPFAKSVTIQDEDLTISYPGPANCKRVEDPEASDGHALWLSPRRYEWCVNFTMARIVFEPGTKLRVSARFKVAKKPGGDGEVLWTGVYDPIHKRGQIDLNLKAKDTPDGYFWQELGTWTPEARDYFWAGPGRFVGVPENPAHDGVYLDAIRVELAD